ncbi:MAG: HAD family phosphatase, partial [Methanobacteriota archaeon]
GVELFFIMDVDGTIIESEDIYFNFMAKAVEEFYGNSSIISDKLASFLHSEKFRTFYGMEDKDILREIVKAVSGEVEENAINTIYSIYTSLVMDNINSIINKDNLINGIEEFLKIRGEDFALVSSSHMDVLRYVVRLLPREPLFIVSADDVKRHKPSPEPYERARDMAPLGRKLIVFEDSIAGLRSARAAGINDIVCIRTCKWKPCFKDWEELLKSNFLSTFSSK